MASNVATTGKVLKRLLYWITLLGHKRNPDLLKTFKKAEIMALWI